MGIPLPGEPRSVRWVKNGRGRHTLIFGEAEEAAELQAGYRSLLGYGLGALQGQNLLGGMTLNEQAAYNSQLSAWNSGGYCPCCGRSYGGLSGGLGLGLGCLLG